MSESPRRLFQLIFLANIISLSVSTCCSGSGKDIHSFLLNWTQAGNEVTFVCCGGVWDPHYIKWQKSFAVKGTHLCNDRGNKRELYDQIGLRSARTLFIMYRHGGSSGDCVDRVLKFYSTMYSTKLIVFGHFNECQASATPFPSQRKTLCICDVSASSRKSGTGMKGANWSRECAHPGTDHFLKYDRENKSPRSLFSFSGKAVAVGCRVHPSVSLTCSACNDHTSKMYLDGLAQLNATVVKTLFSTSDPLERYITKRIDVLMYSLPVKTEYLSYIDIALATTLRSYTFYVKKSTTEPINVRYILEESKLTLYFLTLCLVLCFVVLLVTDLVDPATSGMRVANDIMLFLVATFYSTSCDLPGTVRCCTSRRFVIVAWVLGSFSLSVYFKGQITSWLIARTPEYIVDDPIKLETALDANAILPCVFGNAMSHKRISGSETELLSKIKKALDSNPKKTVKKSVFECLKCASNKYRVCVIVRQPECYLKAIHLGLTESKEPILVAHSALHVRKHYNLRMDFRALCFRIFETDWLHMTDTRCLALQEKPIIEPMLESVNLHTIAQFMLPCFGVSVAVFLLEVFLGRYFIQRARRLSGVRVA